MAYEAALTTFNMVRAGLAQFARLTIAYQDDRQTLAADLEAMIGRLTDQERTDLLYVLEHAVLTLPPDPAPR